MSGFFALFLIWPVMLAIGVVWGYKWGADISVWNFVEAMSCDFITMQPNCKSKNTIIGVILLIVNFLYPVWPGRYLGGYAYFHTSTKPEEAIKRRNKEQEYKRKREQTLATKYPEQFGNQLQDPMPYVDRDVIDLDQYRTKKRNKNNNNNNQQDIENLQNDGKHMHIQNIKNFERDEEIKAGQKYAIDDDSDNIQNINNNNNQRNVEQQIQEQQDRLQDKRDTVSSVDTVQQLKDELQAIKNEARQFVDNKDKDLPPAESS